jgi:hypothetical protein
MDFVQKDHLKKRASFYSAISKLAAAGEKAGLSVEEMIELLRAGLRVDQLLDLIASRLEAHTPIHLGPPHKATRLYLN